ncbi:acylphosphatase [Sphingomonas sp. SM33]|uniref:Acylphosphatase n=2 Tax=Sphingomonas telluris TaxID=2907998 RepID=A0ABS9VQU9_9SPHN|nr:acylphosphatase [Sphingomonas telluris]MCH8617333.1 acylphosphatase [Sphingomonas telluris]
MMTIARDVSVSGRVQGVFFRGWTQEQAERLGVTGWVRNCPDGSVEAHLEGEEGAVNWLVDLIGDGPASARVANVRVREAEVEGLEGFEVRR